MREQNYKTDNTDLSENEDQFFDQKRPRQMTDMGPDTKARDSLNKVQKQMLAELLTNSEQLNAQDRLRKNTDSDIYQDDLQRRELINILRSDSNNRRQNSQQFSRLRDASASSSTERAQAFLKNKGVSHKTN